MESSKIPITVNRSSVLSAQVATSSPRPRARNLSKPFVDPLTVDDEVKSPSKSEAVTPVKNPSISRLRGKSHNSQLNPERKSNFAFSDFLNEEIKADLEDQKKEIILSPDDFVEDLIDGVTFSDDSYNAELSSTKVSGTPSAPTPKTPQSQNRTFSSVNFFQSASPGARTPKSELKRPHEDDKVASRKKRETNDLSSTSQAPAVSTPMEHVPQTPADQSFDSFSQFETPDQGAAEPIAPYTAPTARSSHSTRTSFVDGTFSSYSTGKPFRASLRDSGAARRISFMPPVEHLQVSKEFSRQLGTPVIKFEKNTSSSKQELNDASDNPVEKSAEEADDSEESEISVDESEDEKVMKEEIKEIEKEIEGYAATVLGTNKSPWTRFFKALGLSLLVILISSFTRWWIVEKFEAGYCEAGFVRWKPYYAHITPVKFEEYFDKEYILDQANQLLDYVRPECQPCPTHAVCYSGFKAECEPGFVQETSLLAKYLPIAPTCKPDTQKQKRVAMLTQKALAILRDRNVQVECGSELTNAAIEQNDLRDILYDMKAESLSDIEFSDLWSQAIGDIENEEEVIVQQIRHVDEHSEEISNAITTTDSSGNSVPVKREVTTRTFLRSTSLANIPLGCAIRRSILARLNAHRVDIALLVSTIVGYFITRHWVMVRKQRKARSERLAAMAIARLKAQRTAANEDTRGLTMRCVPVPQLRDEIQPEVASLDTRKRVWADVERLVETNSNVRARQTDIEGEIMRVWEWVGV